MQQSSLATFTTYVYAELQFATDDSHGIPINTPAIILHLELEPNKPTARRFFTIDQMVQLRDDLNRELTKFEEFNASDEK